MADVADEEVGYRVLSRALFIERDEHEEVSPLGTTVIAPLSHEVIADWHEIAAFATRKRAERFVRRRLAVVNVAYWVLRRMGGTDLVAELRIEVITPETACRGGS